MDTHVRLVFEIFLLDQELILNRSLDFKQARIIDLRQSSTCLLTQYWHMVFLQECEVIEEAKTGTCLFS